MTDFQNNSLDDYEIEARNLWEKIALKDWKYFFLKDLALLKRNKKFMSFIVDGDSKQVKAQIE